MHGLNIIKRDNFKMRVTAVMANVLNEHAGLRHSEVEDLAKDYQSFVLDHCAAGMDDLELENPKLAPVFKAIREELSV